VRGSHVLIDRACARGVLAEATGSSRTVFSLPWKYGTLVGTIEVRHELKDPIECSADERNYLSKFHDSVMEHSIDSEEIVETFAGSCLFKLSVSDPSKVSREYDF
jgi:glycerol-3-phosphate dehydrogenase